MCDSDKENPLQVDLFKFEEQEWTWDTKCPEVQEEHYRNVIENYREIIKPQIMEAYEYLRNQIPKTQIPKTITQKKQIPMNQKA